MTLQEMLHNMATKTSFNDAEVDALDHAFATATDQEVHDAVMGLSPVLAKQGKDEKDNFHRLNQRLAVRPGFQQAIPRLHAWREANPDAKTPADAWYEANPEEHRNAVTADALSAGVLGLPRTWTDLALAEARMGNYLKHLAAKDSRIFVDLCCGQFGNNDDDKVRSFWRDMTTTTTWPELLKKHPSLQRIAIIATSTDNEAHALKEVIRSTYTWTSLSDAVTNMTDYLKHINETQGKRFVNMYCTEFDKLRDRQDNTAINQARMFWRAMEHLDTWPEILLQHTYLAIIVGSR